MEWLGPPVALTLPGPAVWLSRLGSPQPVWGSRPSTSSPILVLRLVGAEVLSHCGFDWQLSFVMSLRAEG